MAASIGLETSCSGQVVLLLLGEKQSGKSSAGNTILGRPAFNRNTIRSSRENGTIFGKQVTVVDTPGWSSHSSTPHRVSQEVCRGVSLCNPEPHAILLVLPTTSVFGQRELKAMEAQLKLLQTPIWQQAMVLFTHGDALGAVSIQEHIRHQGQTLHWLLERCANRYQVMTNQPSASEAQIRELLEKIQRVMRTNSGSRETKNMLYTKLRRDLAVEESRQGRQEDIEMTNVYDLCDEAPGQKQRMASVGSRPVLSFILLGRRKSGKSSAGNFILDREEFQVQRYGQTSRCSVGHGSVSGRAVAVVDTPGWSRFGLTNAKKVKTEINRSTSLCPERSKIIFLLAIPVDSFAKKDKRALEEFVSVLGDTVWRRTVVLFTYREELRGMTIKKHIEKKGEPLQEVLQKCGQRHVVFDTGSGHGDQITQLLKTVDQM
ncbi:GTPase IMAP family member 8-like [Notolabrus celidotus]|uniref:GTPase IMAP family member 8-like n=1 Tax=Notolabrus celidotus TaxID=1203425 RepID=UPI0014904337|nr:GTPase IMAP family member 8-like [Notolabrus celidotus]